jgi:hypothetical protein
MHSLHIKSHMPTSHDMGVKFGHLISDERFWAVVVSAILLGIIAMVV